LAHPGANMICISRNCGGVIEEWVCRYE